MSSPKQWSSKASPKQWSPNASPKKAPVIGYIHNLSGLWKGAKCKWFDMQLQTSPDKRMSAVCFSKEKYNIFAEKESSITPVKISNYIIGQSWDESADEEIRINDMTVVQTPASSEYSFQYAADDQNKTKITPLSVIDSQTESGCFVNIKEKLTKGCKPEIVGKNKLQMLKCAITDDTGVLPITIWEDEIENVNNGCVYHVYNVGVRIRDHSKCLTTTRTTRFFEEEGDALQQVDDSTATEMLLPLSDATAKVESIRSVDVELFKSCVECSAKIPPAIHTMILKCLRCGHRMRFDHCKVTLACKITIVAEDDSVLSLTVFSEVIEECLNILDESSLSADEIAEELLMLEKLNISYDNQDIVSKIEQY